MNIEEIRNTFSELKKGKEGILGVASYQEVYDHLMPVQKKRLKEFGTGESVIVLGIFHSYEAMESINTRRNGKTDYEAWNVYAREYHELNRILNTAAYFIAELVDGTPIPATLEGKASRIDRVEDYYSLTVSQRVAAELSGLGWRGKNELIVTRERGCAVRFASVVCPIPLPSGRRMENYCNGCEECLKICSILRKKDVLRNYREQCRRFIVRLGLEGDVCGKCVKACHQYWVKNTAHKMLHV